MILGSKLKAGALQLTLFIAVVITLLLTAFIVLVHTHKQFYTHTNFTIQTARNTNIGIQKALMHEMPLNNATYINLDDGDYKNLEVHRTYWGIFEKVTSVATIKKNKFQKTALIGGIQPEFNKTALYLEDHNKPLVLVGNTKIEGVVYLPKEGVKSGNISGQSYYNPQFIYGEMKTANKLPDIFYQTITQLETLEYELGKIPEKQFFSNQDGKIFTNSFLNPTQVLFSDTLIQLHNNSIIGNIIIRSRTKIVVEATTTLKDVVLIAPEIEIKDHTSGTFQAIATKKINVGNNCKLNYPSALVLNKDQSLSQQQPYNEITIEDKTIVEGVVLYYNTSMETSYKPQAIINEDVEVIGEVYCKGNLELKGTVFGSVFTSHVVATHSGSVYQNHIYNGIITIKELPQHYVGLSFENSQKGIMKWLY